MRARVSVVWDGVRQRGFLSLSLSLLHVLLLHAQDSLIDVCEDYTAPGERLGGARHGERESESEREPERDGERERQ